MNGYKAPRKRFGQHFLTDQSVIQQILLHIENLPAAPLVEIGPGRGALTLPLLKDRGMLDVIEIDNDLVNYLRDTCRDLGDLKIHAGDVLEFDFRSLGYGKMNIIGNLPYNISTPVLFHILDYRDCIDSMMFMLQREVVDRITAMPGNRDYGRLSVMIQSTCSVERLFDIDPQSFTPAPAVVSTFLAMAPLQGSDKPPVIHDQKQFSGIVQMAFNQRRKTIRNSLKQRFTVTDLAALDIDPGARAEDLSVEDYIRMANYATTHRETRDTDGQD